MHSGPDACFSASAMEAAWSSRETALRKGNSEKKTDMLKPGV